MQATKGRPQRSGTTSAQIAWIENNDPHLWDFENRFCIENDTFHQSSFDNAFFEVHGRSYAKWKVDNLTQDHAYVVQDLRETG